MKVELHNSHLNGRSDSVVELCTVDDCCPVMVANSDCCSTVTCVPLATTGLLLDVTDEGEVTTFNPLDLLLLPFFNPLDLESDNFACCTMVAVTDPLEITFDGDIIVVTFELFTTDDCDVTTGAVDKVNVFCPETDWHLDVTVVIGNMIDVPSSRSNWIAICLLWIADDGNTAAKLDAN